MAGEIEEPFRLNFQVGLFQSGSISFGRFESEPLSWERRSIFSHNRYLEEAEKYSKPGSVTEKKAYFEAEFRRKALLKQRSSECQDGGELLTNRNNDLHDFEEYGRHCNESPCSSSPSKCNMETKNQHHEKGDVACFDETTPKTGYGEDTISQHWKSQNYECHPVTTQDEFGETHQSENENIAGHTEQSIGLSLIDHVVDAPSEDNDYSSLACQTSEDCDSISSAPQTTSPPKVKPAAEKKLTRSTLKTQATNNWSQTHVLNGASKVSLKPRTSDSKGLLVKKTEKKSSRPASPLIRSGAKTLKAEELRSGKAVKAKRPSSEKSLPGVRPTVNRSKPIINPSKTHVSQSATGFSFKTDQLTVNRKEEKQAAEMKQFRKSLNFKAKPLPSFYNDQHKVTPISKAANQPLPLSQAMAARRDKNTFKSSVPLNIRPSSSTSSTNRIRFPESAARNHVPEKKDKEKVKDTKRSRA